MKKLRTATPITDKTTRHTVGRLAAVGVGSNEKKPIPISGEKKTPDKKAGFLWRVLDNERFAWLIACMLLGTGLSYALQSLTTLDGSFQTLLLFSFISVLVLAVAYFCWWLPLSLLGTVLLVFAVYHFYHETLRQWIDYWASFVLWAVHGIQYHEIYSYGFPMALLRFLGVFTMCILLYQIIKRQVLFPALVALSAGFLITTRIMTTDDLSAAILTSIAGGVILVPGFYALIMGKSGGLSLANRTRMQIIAVPAAILSILFAVWVTPEDTRDWRSATLVSIVEDIRTLIRGPFSEWPVPYSNFSMYELGFQAQSDRLGGPINLSDETYLHVDSPIPVLLKGRVFDVYTGSNWLVGAADGDLRFNSILWRGLRREALGQDRPLGGNRTNALYHRLTQEIDISISYTTNHFRTLFTTGRIRNLNFSRNLTDATAFFNMRSEVYTRERMHRGQGIVLRTRVWNTGIPGFNELFLELEALGLLEDDSRYYALIDRFTALPDDLPDSVRETALQVTADAETPFRKVLAIVDWLNENFDYTLEPEIVPEGEDFVEFFLKTGEGYCTYFATTLAVMARVVGIPSRYVTGFALQSRDSVTRFAATGQTAHAWVELYFRGIGWVEVDPLNWNPAAPLNIEAPIREQYVPVTPTLPVPDHSLADRDMPVNGVLIDTEPDPGLFDTFWIYALIALALLAVFIAPRVIIRILLGRKNRQFAFSKVYTAKKSNFQCLETYYVDILNQLALLDLTPASAETLITFPIRVDRVMEVYSRELSNRIDGFAAIAKCISEYHFADIMPKKEQVVSAQQYHQKLETLLLARFGKWGYLFKRAIR